jgi:DNA-directed RNA polymerase subunit RPC12/RpoP
MPWYECGNCQSDFETDKENPRCPVCGDDEVYQY